MTHKVYLVEQHITGPAIGWRLLAERLPASIGDAKVGLASGSNKECMFPLNGLHAHDYHAAAHGDEYVQRVLGDVTAALKELNWSPSHLADTGYTVHEIVLP